ncbi:hypothetical protein PIB30_006147 [Stylosanthes scabra]|uniref:Uncharacterized protein n=1 Tax=Stylosanthes scabra TaxID=79078 RepID=A0ABU6X394_9FABA|nr:hypothetical protein [Stylosanthes scabra]
MENSREMWSSLNRDGGRGGGNGDGWSATLDFSGSAGALRKKSKFFAPECNCGTYAILFMSSTLGILINYFMGAHTSSHLQTIDSLGQTPAPHYKYFAWVDEYVVSCDEEVIKPIIHGRGKQIVTQQTDSAQFERIVRELENIIVGLEMQLKNDKYI